MTIVEFTNKMNQWGHERVPFLFVVDFEMEKPLLIRLEDVKPDLAQYEFNGIANTLKTGVKSGLLILESIPISRVAYEKKFERVFHHLSRGDSFLTNLTTKTEIKLDQSLLDIFHLSQAKYKLIFRDEFLVFSPETFVQIKGGRIYSYPMKGTIDASVSNARERILQDQKEISEHVTITDLIRNDLSQVALDVQVKRFRYIDEIRTQSKTLLQVSSEIVGQLESDWYSQLGDIMVRLLPAGSVSGAPKRKTLEIIREVEGEKRGYYTGVFGIFNGQELDSGVMIRYIERHQGQYFYRSGGGITTQSSAASEYQETIDKVYVPVN